MTGEFVPAKLGFTADFQMPPFSWEASRAVIRNNVQLRPDTDIFIVTYPKSGTTWLQNIIRHLLELRYTEPPKFLKMRLKERSPWIDYLGFPAEKLNEYPNPRVFKCHNFPEELDSMILQGNTKPRIIYAVRDPRDVAVSFHHHYNNAKKEQERCELGPFCAGLAKTPAYTWETHVDSWLSLRDRYNMHVVQYEVLKSKTAAEINRIAQFLGVMITDQEVEDIVKKTDIEYMKQDTRVGLQDEDGSETSVLNKGLVGEWKKHFVGPRLEKLAENMLTSANNIFQKHNLIEPPC